MLDDEIQRLRQIRDYLRRSRTLRRARNCLIIRLARRGYTQGQLVRASGLSPARVSEIINAARSDDE